MLITFTCDAYDTIVMFGNVGQHLLEMMGFRGKLSGSIHVEDIPQVRSRLRSGIDGKGDQVIGPNDNNDEGPNSSMVSLKHRAFPLLEMLDAAEKDKCEIKWTST